MKVLVHQIDHTAFAGIDSTSALLATPFTLGPGQVIIGRAVEYDEYFSGAGQVSLGSGISTDGFKFFDRVNLNDAGLGPIVVQDGTYQETKTGSETGTPIYSGFETDGALLSELTAGSCKCYFLVQG